VRHVQRTLHVSERRACRVLGQPRSTQRYPAKRPDQDRILVKAIDGLRRKHPRFGYRRIRRELVKTGWWVNVKRVHRLWKEAGWQIRQKARKRRRPGSSEGGCVLKRAERRNDVWSYDFIFDRTEDGRQLKFLPIIDEFTREGLALEVDRSVTGEDVIDVLAYLFEVHGEPAYIRSDNGPEFVAKAVRKWLEASGVDTLFIEPGSPWENGYIEAFNSRLRDEFLNQELFTSLTEAQVLAERHRVYYNLDRPHSSLDYLSPVEFVASLPEQARLPRAAGEAPDSPGIGETTFTLS
jgi:transposase InsO family protein